MESGSMLEHHLAAAPATYSLHTVGTGAGPGFTSANARLSDGWARSVWEQDFCPEDERVPRSGAQGALVPGDRAGFEARGL